MIRGWNTAVEGALRSSVGATRAARLALTHGSAFSQSYRSQFEPEDAASDILRLAALSGREERDVRVYRRHDDKPGQLRLKVYRLREIIPLSDAVPVLEHFRSEEHTSELQSLMRISYAVFCLKKKTQTTHNSQKHHN